MKAVQGNRRVDLGIKVMVLNVLWRFVIQGTLGLRAYISLTASMNQRRVLSDRRSPAKHCISFQCAVGRLKPSTLQLESTTILL